MYHVWTYRHYPPVYAQQGTCLDLMIDLKTESAMEGMTLDSASSTGTEEQDIEDMGKNPDVKTEEGRADKE